MPTGKAPVGDTRVQFHSDQVHLLVCHETQLALYDASKMEMIQQVYSYFPCCHPFFFNLFHGEYISNSCLFAFQWMPQDTLSGSIAFATYSCNSQLIYAAFTDGNIGVFDADSLKVRCRIAPSAYLSQTSSNRYLEDFKVYEFALSGIMLTSPKICLKVTH